MFEVQMNNEKVRRRVDKRGGSTTHDVIIKQPSTRFMSYWILQTNLQEQYDVRIWNFELCLGVRTYRFSGVQWINWVIKTWLVREPKDLLQTNK